MKLPPVSADHRLVLRRQTAKDLDSAFERAIVQRNQNRYLLYLVENGLSQVLGDGPEEIQRLQDTIEFWDKRIAFYGWLYEELGLS